MTEDLIALRQRSVRLVQNMGADVSDELPLLEVRGERTQSQIVERTLCLTAVLAAAYGFDRSRSMDWLEREGLMNSISANEHAFLVEGVFAEEIASQVECMYVLGWTLGFLQQFDLNGKLPSNLVLTFPDLKKDETTSDFKRRALRRSQTDLLEVADFAYCLNWIIRDAVIHRTPLPRMLNPVAVLHRRKALQWLITEDPWDQVELNT